MHRTIALTLTSLVLGAALLAGCGGDDEASPGPAAAAPTATPSKAAAGAPVSVAIEGFAFAPRELQVEAGQEITWTNEDSAPHTVTARSGAELDSGTLAQGGEFTTTAPKAGTTIEYFCTIHPSMVAKITVR